MKPEPAYLEDGIRANAIDSKEEEEGAPVLTSRSMLKAFEICVHLRKLASGDGIRRRNRDESRRVGH